MQATDLTQLNNIHTSNKPRFGGGTVSLDSVVVR